MSIHNVIEKLNSAVRAKVGSVKTDAIAESTANAGVDVDGVLLKDGAVTASGGVTAETGAFTGAAANLASGTVAIDIGRARYTTFDKTVTLPAAASAISLGLVLPADSYLIGFAAKITDALSGAGGGAKLGIGASGANASAAALWGAASALTLNTKITKFVGSKLSAAKGIALYALSSDGINAKGTVGAGAVRVTGTYVSVQALS